MANAQADEFIKTMTANRAQLAKADHHKEVWFYERRQREGDAETQIRKEGERGVENASQRIGWAEGNRALFELISVRERGRKFC